MRDTHVTEGTRFQVGALVALRLLVGWHFLYEGLAKLTNPYWSSAAYLGDSKWVLHDVLVRVAASSSAITTVDYLNMWGLTLIGLALMLGVFERVTAVTAIVLLALYYVAAPPFGYSYAMPAEGSYLVVNKILIEIGALVVLLAHPTAKVFGLDHFVDRVLASRRASARAAAPVVVSTDTKR